MEKRGNITHISFIIFSVFIVGIITISILAYINEASKDTDFKKRYVLLDTGFLLDTIYASPGNLYADYNLGDVYKYQLIPEENTISISSTNNALIKRFYFVKNKFIPINKNDINVQLVIIENNDTSINVYGKQYKNFEGFNTGDNSQAGSGGGGGSSTS
jgi:hypothetical protein